ncbi:response regulator [Marinobacter sp. SS5-14b]|uniref:response regulator n=1 Tax=Marinobacter sp. SS5-14b TaxID=3050456 RepID=UPI0026E0BD43|nr:response regulator [Marinobacter sp. SS5-14b]
MAQPLKPPIILIADDDPDDQLMIRDAFAERCNECQLCFVANGVELMTWLKAQGEASVPADCPMPDLLLLDLNMPLKDGRQSLLEIRANPELNTLPTVVLTTSRNDEDKSYCLANGANDFIVKPARYTELLNIVESLKPYWSDRQPNQPEGNHD